jgi:hypothetical protein
MAGACHARSGKRISADGLEARGRLDLPIASLRLTDLDAMASVAISRFVVLASHKIKETPGAHPELENLLMG